MANVILLQSPPPKLEEVQKTVFSKGATDFLQTLHKKFSSKVENLYRDRLRRSVDIQVNGNLQFCGSAERYDKSWSIAPLPSRLLNRHLDLGDVSASNTAHFVSALNEEIQGVQVDFDDGHCPTWKNQLLAYQNINLATNGKLPGAPMNIAMCPVLMLRPRAWNIIEHNILIDGEEAIGPLVDFGILMYHNARQLYEANSGPYFYLSKIEGASEAKLWNEIFVWSQLQLGLPQGTVKACVLIENIVSCFELDEILYALKEHSLGLNCGIWDYCASIIAKFGHRKGFLLPDRNKYVTMERSFLKNYMRLVVSTCHARGAPATGGMAAAMLMPGSDGSDDESKRIISKVLDAKMKEIEMGADGFLVYDIRVVPHINRLWKNYGATPNQIARTFEVNISPSDLLTIPSGGVTLLGLKHNVAVSIQFVYHWLAGIGHFFYNGNVEDSATAEISRWQVWQWIRFSLWKNYGATPNQIARTFEVNISPSDLLTIPSGGVTLLGLKHNVAVSIQFVYHWLAGIGHFFYNGNVEDSATAEISRWQVWQWIRFSTPLEDDPKQRVTINLVEKTVSSFVAHAHKNLCRSNAERKRLTAARYMCTELFLSRNPPEFITTHLNDNHKFRTLHNKALLSNL